MACHVAMVWNCVWTSKTNFAVDRTDRFQRSTRCTWWASGPRTTAFSFPYPFTALSLIFTFPFLFLRWIQRFSSTKHGRLKEHIGERTPSPPLAQQVGKGFQEQQQPSASSSAGATTRNSLAWTSTTKSSDLQLHRRRLGMVESSGVHLSLIPRGAHGRPRLRNYLFFSIIFLFFFA